MEVVLYSTHCPRCIVLEKKLNSKNVAYTEVNDIEAMEKKGIMSVPVLEVDGSLMNFVEANNWINNI